MVSTKREMYALLGRGAFGNRNRTWQTYEELTTDGFAGLVSIRTTGGAGGLFIPDIEPTAVPSTLSEYGLRYGEYHINESMPDELIALQGELMRTHRGLSLHYSRAHVKMREALKQAPENAEGLITLMLLRRVCDPASAGDLVELLDIYPDHVIEFSAYTRDVGIIPGRNTIVWEVRAY